MTEQQAKQPEELRREIEETRAELGDTVDALSQKADVKGQVTEKVSERTDALRERVSSATPEDAKRAAAQVAHSAEERPFPAIGVALAAGLVVGWLIGRR
jgi:ElaB/YqjD/DUF883 family membrane-anchored ribosome-binding protein